MSAFQPPSGSAIEVSPRVRVECPGVSRNPWRSAARGVQPHPEISRSRPQTISSASGWAQAAVDQAPRAGAAASATIVSSGLWIRVIPATATPEVGATASSSARAAATRATVDGPPPCIATSRPSGRVRTFSPAVSRPIVSRTTSGAGSDNWARASSRVSRSSSSSSPASGLRVAWPPSTPTVSLRARGSRFRAVLRMAMPAGPASTQPATAAAVRRSALPARPPGGRNSWRAWRARTAASRSRSASVATPPMRRAAQARA